MASLFGGPVKGGWWCKGADVGNVKWNAREEEQDVMDMKLCCQRNWVEHVLNTNQFLAPSEVGGSFLHLEALLLPTSVLWLWIKMQRIWEGPPFKYRTGPSVYLRDFASRRIPGPPWNSRGAYSYSARDSGRGWTLLSFISLQRAVTLTYTC